MEPVAYDQEPGSPIQTQIVELALNPFGVLRRRWIWMSLVLVIGLAATGALVATWVPAYQATATVLVSSQQIPEDFVKSTVRGLDSLSNVNALVGEVLSQRNLSQLIEKHDLYPETGRNVPHGDLINRMRTNISITPQRNVNQERPRESSSIFVISYEGETPEAAAQVANSLAAILISVSLDKRSEQARRTTDFLRRELVRAESDLAEVNREISEFNRTYRGELPSDLQPLLQKLERLQAQRKSLSEQISSGEDRLLALQTAKSSSATEEMLMDLRMQLNSEIAIHTDEHPNVIALKRRIERMESDMGETGERPSAEYTLRNAQIEATRREVAKLREDLVETEAQLKEIDARVDRVPRRAEEFAALEQRASVLRENYLEFMRKVKEAELAETMESAQQGPQVSMLDHARPPTSPTQSPMMYLVPGVLGAFAAAAAIGVGLELIDPVVLSAGHLEAVGPAPVLGNVYRLG
jgi:uncharacterized protein involved in exopolysaccharide biosynthesis